MIRRTLRLVLVFVAPLVAMSLALAPSPEAHGYALLGPSRAEDNHQGGDHTPTDPSLGQFQVIGAGFRWSTAGLNFSFDQSFSNAFGQNGKQAVTDAFALWDAAFGQQNAALTTGFQTGMPIADIESIALHEIGHALGLHHTDQAGAQNKNYGPNGNIALSNPGAVMHSQLNFGEIQRTLSQDDVDGINYLYSQQTMIPTLNALFEVTQTAGPGDPNFTEAGQAAMGGTVGAHFDIFAMDLGAATPGARTLIYGGSGVGGNTSFNGQAMGGFFDGVPLTFTQSDNASHGQTLQSIDIIFNTNPAARLAVNPSREPTTYLMAAMALVSLGLFAARRRRRN